jgi:hypothetical protein
MHRYYKGPPPDESEDDSEDQGTLIYPLSRGGSCLYNIRSAAFRGYDAPAVHRNDVGIRIARSKAWNTSQDF